MRPFASAVAIKRSAPARSAAIGFSTRTSIPGFEECAADVGMSRGRNGDNRCVHPSRSGCEIFKGRTSIFGCGFGGARRIRIYDSDQLGHGRSMQYPHVIPAEGARAYDGHSKLLQ